MFSAVRGSKLYSVCGLALLVWGCPKRQTSPRIVYVPAPPPASAPTSGAGGESLTIEEPPPEPAEVAPEEPPPPTSTPRRRRVPRAEPQPTAVEPESEETTPPAEVPALAPRESAQQQTALRNQIRGMHARLEQRMKQLDSRDLSAQARATLQDARTFLAQSRRAGEEGDLQRALNLAQKSDLLVSALE